MATRAQFEAKADAYIDEGNFDAANRIRTEKLGLPAIPGPATAAPPPPPNNDPQLQVDTGWQEAQNVLGSLPGHAVNAAAEFSNAGVREVANVADFFGPGSLNAGLRIVGAGDYQLPTFNQGLDALPGGEGGFMAPGVTRDAVRGAGGSSIAAGGFLPVGGRNVATPVGAGLDLLGLGAAKPAPYVAPVVAGAPAYAPPPPATVNTEWNWPWAGKSRQSRNELVNAGSESVNRAGYVLDPYTGKARTDQTGSEAIRQGLAPDFVSMVEAAGSATKAKLSQMVDMLKRGREFRRLRTSDRPSNVLGDSLLGRYEVVRDTNRRAGSQIDEVAESLNGEMVDASDAFEELFNSFNKMDINLQGDVDGIVPEFTDSAIEGLGGPQATVKRILNRVHRIMSTMPDPRNVDAARLHKLKRYIDEIVTYGKGVEGLGGKTDLALKTLRHNVNEILGAAFPEYAKVNKTYSESISALQALQDVAGQKMDLVGPHADQALGTLLRRWSSNAQSRIPLKDATLQLDHLAKKYTSGDGKGIVPYEDGGALAGPVRNFDDDIETQVQMLGEIERLLGSQADNSFQGDLQKVADRTAETMIDVGAGQGTTAVGLLVDGARAGYKKMQGINDENLVSVLEELMGGNYGN